MAERTVEARKRHEQRACKKLAL